MNKDRNISTTAAASNNTEGDVSLIRYALNSTLFWGVAVFMFLISGTYIGNHLHKKYKAEAAASKDALASLTGCSKMEAQKLLAAGRLLKQADLNNISEQCSLPAATIEDQKEVLSY
ncbi:hypothetical protein [Comamonas testosteroni]|uniref:hypothetical protein n=1 Tax=Comamonas testosteroni TaxID=285 RepID=UPI0012D33B4A|nr:hypothetical protein [Comamonas testosteroni]